MTPEHREPHLPSDVALVDALIHEWVEFVGPYLDRCLRDHEFLVTADVPTEVQIALGVLDALGHRHNYDHVFEGVCQRKELAGIEADENGVLLSLFQKADNVVINSVHEFADKLMDAGVYEQLRVTHLRSIAALRSRIEELGSR